MALTFSSNPFNITSELIATQDITISGIQYYNLVDNCDLMLQVKIGSTVILTLSVEPTATTHTFSNLNINSVKAALYAAAEGKALSTCVTLRAVNSRFVSPASIETTTNAGSLTIAARNSALVTTANVIDMFLADPANLAFSWTRPHTAFRARIKFYVHNGTSYIEIFNRSGFGSSGASSSSDLKDYGGTDYTDAIVGSPPGSGGAMLGVSPRNYKVEIYTQFNASSIVDLGTLNDSDIITNGMVYSGFGGKVKAFSTSFLAKPIKYWTGTVWSEKPLKHWNGTTWAKSKN
jgi:hypothetical protein